MHRVKIKRILIYYRELGRMHISHEGAMILMTYIFNVSERWIIEIIRDWSIDELDDVSLPHVDLDLQLIDKFANKIRSQAIRTRKDQLQLFN